ncbi:MAG: RraA family protein [Vicinamibacterales bacterium]
MSSNANAGAKRFASATLYEAAGGRGALPRGIRSPSDHDGVWGPALTVASAPGDNIWIHRAIDRAQHGDVMVVTTGGMFDAGYWGDLMTRAGIRAGIAGLVIDGCVRDVGRIKEHGFPVFCRGICIRGATKRSDAVGSIGEPITVGDTTIVGGDLVVGDGDGVVVVPKYEVQDVLRKAAQRESAEAAIRQRLSRDGTPLLDLLVEFLSTRKD